ncbi:Hypothetical YciO protein, TsaC/YrdC paralog [hydrothermal vent metagenome]|uniref:Hypothetical YciO protein, TsaC/YrdC paralog n=1 Tax=hydrothermal vent metagenome TaxID=652676 RepID=A0A1W1BPM9_9ZZZZ
MSAEIITIHQQNPHARSIEKVVNVLKNKGLIVYPTESGYALGCTLGNTKAYERIIKIRQVSKKHNFTLMMQDLSQIGEYAKVDNNVFRILKNTLPDAYTFILEGTRIVPKKLLNDKRKTIGIRVSSNNIVQHLLQNLQEPMMSISLVFPEITIYDVDDVVDLVGKSVDMIIDGGYCPPEPTTVIDLSNETPILIRH